MPDRIKVLLADDHPVVREGLRTMLATAADIEIVEQASNGLEAVEKAARHHPHIVLIDLRMPHLDGLEAIRRIKKETPSVLVIVFTICDNEAFVIEAIRAGAEGYLAKDASRDLLLHTIRAVHSGGMLIKSALLREIIAGLPPSEAPFPEFEPDPSAIFGRLTHKEHQVLNLLVEGLTNKEIGDALFISEDTAKRHVQNIMAKLGVSDRTQAAVMAVHTGLVS